MYFLGYPSHGTHYTMPLCCLRLLRGAEACVKGQKTTWMPRGTRIHLMVSERLSMYGKWEGKVCFIYIGFWFSLTSLALLPGREYLCTNLIGDSFCSSASITSSLLPHALPPRRQCSCCTEVKYNNAGSGCIQRKIHWDWECQASHVKPHYSHSGRNSFVYCFFHNQGFESLPCCFSYDSTKHLCAQTQYMLCSFLSDMQHAPPTVTNIVLIVKFCSACLGKVCWGR